MKLALLALLAFAAPAPFAEATVSAEEDVVVHSLKSPVRPSASREPSPHRAPPPPSRAPRRIVRRLPARSLIEWTPSAFTRPPPLS
jgi:hypothetical protein